MNDQIELMAVFAIVVISTVSILLGSLITLWLSMTGRIRYQIKKKDENVSVLW